MPQTNDTPSTVSATTHAPERPVASPRRPLGFVIRQIRRACELEKEIKERVEALREFHNHPPMVHRSSLGPDAKDLECSICFYTYWAPRTLEGELPAAPEFPVRLPCGHVYGVICISKWLKDKRTCPLCKAEMERTVDLTNQVLEKLHLRENIEMTIEHEWGMWCGFGTMRDTVHRDGFRTRTNPLSAIDTDGIVERELEEMERKIGVMEEVLSDEENVDAPTIFKEVLRLIAPINKATMCVLLSTLTRARYHPWAVRLCPGEIRNKGS